jgi:predicted DsbA family dithiol-disulfide isomerase
MGELIVLKDWHRERTRTLAGTLPAFFFDPSCPFSYLAAERIERTLGEVHWVPTAAASLHAPGPPLQVALHDALERDPLDQTRIVMARAEHQALTLRLPLVWPDRFPAGSPAALRVAAHAAESGAAARFALAAARLAFCGGFDLEDRAVLADAARAAELDVDEALAAAANPALDGPIDSTARGLKAHGVRSLPAIRVGRRLISGERMLEEAAPPPRPNRRPAAG